MSKADEPVQPTEEQVKSANAAEEQKWQGDFKEEDLRVPYKREEQEEAPEDKPEDPQEEKEPELEEYTEPTPVVTVEDPGEYSPADYSFEVTLADGKTKTIKTPEDAESIADDPDNFETPKQLMDFINKSQRMVRKLDEDKDRWESQKSQFDSQMETQSERQQTVDNMVSEFQYLVGKGLIPKVSTEDANADWTDPEVLKNPGVKEQAEIINYMVKENGVREKAGVKPMTSVIDAYNAWKVEVDAKQDKKDQKAAGEARKTAGARVAGVSPSQQGSFVPKGIAVGNPNILRRGAADWDN